MNRIEAFKYVQYYAAKEKLQAEKFIVVNTNDKFRIVIFAVDFEYRAKTGILTVRASINHRVNTRRDDFIAIIPQLNKQYYSEIAGGVFEYDTTASEIGKFPYGINLLRNYIDPGLPPDQFYIETEALLKAAIRWGNKYYVNIFDALNKERKLHRN